MVRNFRCPALCIIIYFINLSAIADGQLPFMFLGGPAFIKKSAVHEVSEAFWTMWPHHGRRIALPGPVKDAIPLGALCTQLCAWARTGFPEKPVEANTITVCLELR